MLVCILKLSLIRKPSTKSKEVRRALADEQAVEIYNRKIAFMQSLDATSRRERTKQMKDECAALGVRYRVSPKTIMDVWNRKTMVVATSHLWDVE